MASPSTLEQAIDVLARWSRDPIAFVREALGVTDIEDWQVEALRAYLKHDRISIRSAHGVGKALFARTPVLTPHGWVDIGDLKPGDSVATVDGSFTEVLGVHPQGERELFRVTLDDGSFVLADADHLWLTHSRNERQRRKPPTVRTTAEIAATLTYANGVRRGINHALPQLAAVEHPRAALPIDPYLLGVMLGDGDARGSISIGNAALEDTLSLLRAAGADIGKITPTNSGWVVRARGCQPAWRLLGLEGCRAHEKFVPKVYRFASVAQRIALLQGVLDTDGTVGSNNAVVLDITAPRLADDITEIVRSLGGVVRRTEKWGQCNGKRCRRVYRLFLSLPPGVSPFRLPAKANRYRPSTHHNKTRTLNRLIASVEPAGRGEAVCIRVAHPSALFVTKDHIVTHNSTVIVWLVLLHMTTRFPAQAVVTGSNFEQLKKTTWAGIGTWLQQMPEDMQAQWEYTTEALTLKSHPTKHFVALRTASKDRSQNLAGFHSPNMLVLVDEASAVDDAIYEVLEGALTTRGSKQILTGNPTQASGTFFDSHNKDRTLWWTRKVAAADVPRLVAPEWIERQATKFGRDSNFYRVRVLGEFPLQDADGVIPLDLIESAVGRDVATLDVAPIWGLDPARFGDDRSALCKRQGNAVLEPVKAWQGLDGGQLAGKVAAEWLDTPRDLRPQHICVDTIGVGASVFDFLRRDPTLAKGETRIVSVNVAETAARSDKYSRLRDELWFKCRDWFAGRDCKICDDAVLIGELAGPRYEITPAGKLQVESKDSMKRRGLRSPDVADALIMTFSANAQPAREASGYFGQALIARTDWNVWGGDDHHNSAWRG